MPAHPRSRTTSGFVQVHTDLIQPLAGPPADANVEVVSKHASIWLAMAAALGVWLVATPAVAGGGDCTVQVGDFDKEPYPLCSCSCRWADVSPDAVVEVLSQPDRWPATFRTISAGRIVSEGRLLIVYLIKPFARRQVTIELTTAEVLGSWRVSWRKASKQEPLAEGLVEIEIFEGWWEVASDGNGGSVVTTGTRLNPGHDVPQILVRKTLPMQLRRLLRQLRRAVVPNEEADPVAASEEEL
mgnify:CR=1 FL=1